MTEKREYKVVPTIEGLYDYENLKRTLVRSKVGKNPLAIGCLFGKHNFVEGWLDEKPSEHCGYDLLNPARFCEHCLKIDCIHEFTTHYYEVKQHEFFSHQYEIRHCSVCGRRICANSYGVEKSSSEGKALIQEVNLEMGGDIPIPIFGGEFYTAVSYTLLHKGKEAAKELIRNTYLSGRISKNAMKLSGY